jgi:hypothetical protein
MIWMIQAPIRTMHTAVVFGKGAHAAFGEIPNPEGFRFALPAYSAALWLFAFQFLQPASYATNDTIPLRASNLSNRSMISSCTTLLRSCSSARIKAL